MPSVGMVPIGTGCDYIRNFEVGRSMLARFRAAVSPTTIEVSLGHCRIRNSEVVRERVFAMVLGLGFDAEVVRLFLNRKIRKGRLAGIRPERHRRIPQPESACRERKHRWFIFSFESSFRWYRDRVLFR